MRRPISLVLLSGACVLTAASLAAAGPTAKPTVQKFTATLNAGQEVPHPKGAKGATGHFVATLSGTSIKWTLTFSHLTGAANAAHLHKAPPGKPGPVAVALCGPCKSPATGTITGEAAASTLTAIRAGQYYVNVHTPKNPDGEIRGQVKRSG
jgi:hypothetical protein